VITRSFRWRSPDCNFGRSKQLCVPSLQASEEKARGASCPARICSFACCCRVTRVRPYSTLGDPAMKLPYKFSTVTLSLWRPHERCPDTRHGKIASVRPSQIKRLPATYYRDYSCRCGAKNHLASRSVTDARSMANAYAASQTARRYSAVVSGVYDPITPPSTRYQQSHPTVAARGSFD